ncbi:hypothetical protein IMSAGC002_02631 [Lachnospiraceae bacterium]|nr:hypothetical protein IMSAGC002_02631 [Lachnospiraceae bacterium]
MKKKVHAKKVMPYIGLFSIIVIVFLILYRHVDLNEPLGRGDSTVGYAMIKSMINTGTWMKDDLLGNGTFNMYEHNTGNMLDFAIIWILCLVSENVYTVANLYYFLTFVLAAFTCYFVLEKLTGHVFISIIFSVLFAFTPYAQLRSIDIGHMIWLGCFYIVPLSVYVCLVLLKDTELKHIKFCVFMTFFIGLSNIYYIFFFGILVFSVCLRCWLRNRKKDTIKKYIGLPSLLILSTAINMSPSLLFYLNSEPNPSAGVFNRMPQNAEVYGLKLLNLLLPRLNHRWDFLSRIHSDYMSLTATEMETEIASLGIIGAVGFLILLLVFFFHIKSNNRFIEDLAYLNICTIIIGIMGGGGCILAYLIPMIRSYARISIFIAFFSIALLALLCMELYKKLSKKGRLFGGIALTCLLGIGLWDQTETYPAERQQELIAENSIYIEFLDRILDGEEGNKIYEYPGESLLGGWGNEYLQWYILDDSKTAWNSGGMLGRKEGYWMNRMEKQKPADFLKQLKLDGFSGILFDYTKCVSVYGVEWTDEIIKGIVELTGEKILYSVDNRFQYIDLKNDYFYSLQVEQGDRLIYPIYKDILNETIIEDGYQRLAGENAEIIVNNDSGNRKDIILSLSIMPCSGVIFNQTLDIFFNDSKICTVLLGEYPEEQDISIPLSVDAGESVLKFKINADLDTLTKPQKDLLYYIKNDTYLEEKKE